MEPKMKAFCNEKHSQEINELSSKLWWLQRSIEKELSKSEQLNTYEPIVELIKQASWLLDIASNICYFEKPFKE